MSEIYYRTPKKPIFNPKTLKNEFYKSKRLSQGDSKENIQRNWLFESPFCKLLNESEREPIEKYQVLVKESYIINEKEIDRFYAFFEGFNQRNSCISQLFNENVKFEVIGEEIFPLEKTINALSSNFKTFEVKDRKEINIDEMIENDEEILIVSNKGVARTFDGRGVEFIMSCKFTEEKIKEAKLKLIWV